jgi:hypothetical protein
MVCETHRRIWESWHNASVKRDQVALLSLYAEEAILESPMIPKVLNQQSGTITGRDNIRKFLDEARRQAMAASSVPKTPMRWWREDRFFSAGDTLVWEYPRHTPDGDQIDVVEVMRIDDDLIQHHRVYWGWKLATAVARG